MAKMFVLKPHWSVRYFMDRSRLRRWERKNPGCPWFTPPAVEILESWIKPTDTVLEYGSGRSTVWLAKHAQKVVSVEQSPEWFQIVKDRLVAAGVESKVDLRLISDVDAMEEYSGVARAFADAHFDIVIVDGHFRRECIIASRAKVKPGGMLIYDDSQVHRDATERAPARHLAFQPLQARTDEYRNLWRPVFSSMADWRVIWTSDGVKDTSIWVKPVTAVAGADREYSHAV
ncbi:MAG: class I SAM-dependent methyltransferase [Parvibaculum sp.]|nr:class I SAM-dependent methyltransferase [Parvibaculum sp.]